MDELIARLGSAAGRSTTALDDAAAIIEAIAALRAVREAPVVRINAYVKPGNYRLVPVPHDSEVV